MGTNFYHRYNHCECCGRYDERHICKSLVIFRGFRPDPDWPDDFTGPVLDTWQRWKAELLADGEVWSEYGVRWEVDDFIREVEATSRASRRRQYDWVQAHYNQYRDWLDPEEFSFYDGGFS